MSYYSDVDDYKEKDIDNRYLKNILNFCKHHYRPKEQVEKLQQLAVDRGVR